MLDDDFTGHSVLFNNVVVSGIIYRHGANAFKSIYIFRTPKAPSIELFLLPFYFNSPMYRPLQSS